LSRGEDCGPRRGGRDTPKSTFEPLKKKAEGNVEKKRKDKTDPASR